MSSKDGLANDEPGEGDSVSDGPHDLNRQFLSALPDDGPVVMVNLVRFRERSLDGNGSGWDAYTRYSQADMPLLKRVGGTVLWAGHVEGAAVGDLGDGRWDWVVVVLYPSRAAFLSMMTSPEYALANVDRENAVEDHVILAAKESYSKLLA
jgi:uncharacterized protein (DUF1330 family)